MLRRPQVSDGKPLTADDYAWTFQQASNPENKYPYRSQLDQIASYTAPDPKTIVVKVKEPIAPGLERAIAAISYPLPKHVWEKLDWNDPTKNPEMLKPTVGAAEWKLVEWRRDDSFTVAANESFFLGRPNFDTYTTRIVPNRSVQLQMFKSGELDIFSPQPSDYKETKALASAEMFEWQPAAPPWSYMGFNLRCDHVNDVLVRRALSHAIDRQGIIDAVVEGLGKPIYSTFPPTHWVYNPDVPKYEYSLDRARQLLKEAGYTSGAGGVLEKAGQREFDREKRKAVYGEIQKIIAEDAPYVFLYYGLGYASVNKRVGGVRATPLGITADDGILGWYVR